MLDLRKIPLQKERFTVTRVWENEADPNRQPYVARFRYEDEDCLFEMYLTAQEADIYQNARTEYEKAKQTHPDPKIHRYFKSQKFLSLHEHFAEQIRMFHGFRGNDPTALERVEEYCRLQIQYAPVALRSFKNDPFTAELPEHTGYEILCTMLEERGEVREALHLAELARDEGWKGNWENRSRRLREQLGNSGDWTVP